MQASVIASRPRHIHRLAVSASFLVQGLCFSTWASRIPTVQQKMHLSETELGGVPVGLIVSLPITGWLVAKHGSRTMTVLAVLSYSGALPLLGLAQNVPQLLAALVVFGFGSNMANISVNTQGVGVEAIYGKSILATFNGIWSLAGFVGAALGTAMIGWGIAPLQHFTIMALVIWLGVALMRPYLVPADAPSPADQPLFVLPDKSLMLLGVLAFCSLLSEGTMFDWSGVYFKKIVLAEKAQVGLGFSAFMAMMATGRFFADWFTDKFGRARTLQLSGTLTTVGLALAVAFPTLLIASIGFMLVGLGVSSVVPLVYSAAGKSRTMPAGVALAAVSTVGFAGFLLGPPLIGLVAGATSLRVSFAIIAVMGLAVAVLARPATAD